MDIIEQSILGILPFLTHLGAALLLLLSFIFIYVKITPYPETLESVKNASLHLRYAMKSGTVSSSSSRTSTVISSSTWTKRWLGNGKPTRNGRS